MLEFENLKIPVSDFLYLKIQINHRTLNFKDELTGYNPLIDEQRYKFKVKFYNRDFKKMKKQFMVRINKMGVVNLMLS